MKIAESCRPWALAALAQDGLLPSIHAKHSWAQQKAPPPRSDGYGFLGQWKDMFWMDISIWVNYNDLTATSLEIMVNKGNHPQMALIHLNSG